MHKTDG